MYKVGIDAKVTSKLWIKIRSANFYSEALEIIHSASPVGVFPVKASHVRTAHYAAFQVEDSKRRSWLVRIGVTSLSDQKPVENSGPFGTSIFTPSGQYREALLSQAFKNSGADVIASVHYAQVGQLDVTWAPFIAGSNEAVSAKQWHRALTYLYTYSPDVELPVFTNRAKAMQRLSEFRDTELAISLQEQYDAQLKELFQVSSKWSVVHGDAHGGNALLVDARALLFDFDTTCWAPSVWDLTHLLNRAGDGVDSGYTASELAPLFDFTSEEIDAALTLRRIASKIAQKHREQSYFYGEHDERENHDRSRSNELLVAQG
jgi:hypothetical protein